MTRKISEEIKFYERIKPFSKLSAGLFGNGCGIADEHLITIDLKIITENISYIDSFEWDVLNESNMYD